MGSCSNRMTSYLRTLHDASKRPNHPCTMAHPNSIWHPISWIAHMHTQIYLIPKLHGNLLSHMRMPTFKVCGSSNMHEYANIWDFAFTPLYKMLNGRKCLHFSPKSMEELKKISDLYLKEGVTSPQNACPFVNHHAQTNLHASSRTQCAQTNPCTHQLSCPLGPLLHNLGVLLMLTRPNLFGVTLLLVAFTPCFTSCLAKPLGVFVYPMCPLAQLVQLLGVEATPNFLSFPAILNLQHPLWAN